MVTSKRVSNAKSEKYNGNIHKRGKVEMKEVGGPRVSGWFRWPRMRHSPAHMFCSALQILLILSRLLPPQRFSVFLRRASGFMHLFTADVGVRARAQKSKISSSVGPVLLGFFVFVVVGSGASQEDTV